MGNRTASRVLCSDNPILALHVDVQLDGVDFSSGSQPMNLCLCLRKDLQSTLEGLGYPIHIPLLVQVNLPLLEVLGSLCHP